MSDQITFYDEIEAYCTQLSYEAGALAGVCVSTRCESYDVVVERWGGQRKVVWQRKAIPGSFAAPPEHADAWGCRWPLSFEIATQGWASGFYLVTVTALGAEPGRNTAHACFVLRSRQRRRALFVLATNTWNAYNTWGGASLYTGGSQVSFRRPFARGLLSRPELERDDRKARPVRFGETADVDGEIYQTYRMANGYPASIGSTGWFTHERRFVEWAERQGYQFDYAISSDFDEVTDLLDGYEVVIGVGHDEYWSAAARDAIDAHIARGKHYVSMSGNTMFWQVRLVGDGGGAGRDHMVCHKYRAHLEDPVLDLSGRSRSMSGLWCDPLVGRPEWTTLGAGSVFGLYHRFGRATPRGVGGFTVFRGDHWLLAGTDLGYGDVLGADHGVVGYETVGCPTALDEVGLPVVRGAMGMPTDHEIVAYALSSNLGIGDYPKSIAALDDQGDLEFLAERFYGDQSATSLAKVRHGNAALVVCRPQGPTGGEVVTIGSTDWVFGLGHDERVAQVTRNILDRHLEIT